MLAIRWKTLFVLSLTFGVQQNHTILQWGAGIAGGKSCPTEQPSPDTVRIDIEFFGGTLAECGLHLSFSVPHSKVHRLEIRYASSKKIKLAEGCLAA